jgi:hypothetical protein
MGTLIYATAHFTPAERRLWPQLVRALRKSVSRYASARGLHALVYGWFLLDTGTEKE